MGLAWVPVGTRPAVPACGCLAGPAAAPSRSCRTLHPPGRQPSLDPGGAERGHGRGGAGQPPAPTPGGLAAAHGRAVGPVQRPHQQLRALRGDGATRWAAGCQLPVRVLQQRHHSHGCLHRLHRLAHPDRVAALTAVALVGQGRGHRDGGAAVGGGTGPPPAGPREPDLQESPGRAACPSRPPGDRRCGQRGDPPGRAGSCRRVAGSPLSPRQGHGAPAATLAGPGGRGGGGGVAGRGGRRGDGRILGVVLVAAGISVALLPLATGAAILRYRLYDLDRIISRTVAYGLLTVLLGLGYAGVVLGLGRLLPRGSSLVVAAATLAVAAAFQPARRRIQRAVDRRFNRRRHDAARIIEAFGARLRDQVDLDSLTAELLGAVDRTMAP